MRKIIVTFALASGLFMWQCTKIDQELSLKESLAKSSARINNAVSEISATKGYELMSVTGDEFKSEEGYNDSIALDLIAGIYEFQPAPFYYGHFNRSMWFYKKTGESDNLIVRLPQRLVFHPKYLHLVYAFDTEPVNNFEINASEYHYYYSLWNRYDYRLAAGFLLDGEDIGTLEVTDISNSFTDRSYSSKFAFTDDYSIEVSRQTGDTVITSFGLYEGDESLLKESVYRIRNENRFVEIKYVLSIGNVDIVRTTGIDSIQVFLDGVLQKTAAVKITDDDTDENTSVCRKRDILLTFDDGTTQRLSELIEPARTKLRTLLSTMHSMYFAKHVVDYIAMSIYYYR